MSVNLGSSYSGSTPMVTSSITPGQRSPVLQRTLEITETSRKINRSLFWGFINVALIGIVVYDLLHRCPIYVSVLHYVQWAALVFLVLNLVYHICCYVYYSVTLKPVEITKEQQKLLRFKDGDSSFVLQSPEKVNRDEKNNTPLNMSALSWRSFEDEGINRSDQGCALSFSSPSWVYHRGSPGKTVPDTSPQHSDARPDTSGVEFITDESSLSQYLRDYESHDRTSATTPSTTLNRSQGWSHPLNPKSQSKLVNNQYQMAPKVVEGVNSPVTDKNCSPLSQYGVSDFWRKRSIDPSVAGKWCDNLRMWLSCTILARVVSEISKVDEHFIRHGLSELQIGRTGLERLRKVGASQHAPATLQALLPFLELTSCQEYLVTRIKELAKGGCMSEFRWNSGGTFQGKAWEPHLPTDCAVIMHMLSSYLDTQLPPLPQQPDGKPFSSQHICKNGDKLVKGPGKLVIHNVTVNPPHYVLVDGEEVYEPPKGRNNMFYTVLLFLHHIKTKQHGMLGRVNLGPAGVNVLWVIE